MSKIPPRDPRLDEMIERRVTAAIARFRPAAIPMFSHRSGRPELIGTGVGLRAGDDHLVLTAAHVMREFADDTVFVPYRNGWKALTGVAHNATTPGIKDFPDDRIDAAVFALDPASAGHWDHWLTPIDLLPGCPAGPSDRFVLVGFPINKVKYDFKRGAVGPRGLKYFGKAAPTSAYANVNALVQAHIAVTFRRKKTMQNGRLGAAPSPRGISGGMLIWTPSVLQPLRIGDNRLAAIFIEHHDAPNHLLLSTRIDVHLAIIRDNLPHLRQFVLLPVSAKMNTARSGD